MKNEPKNIYHRELHTILKFSALINSSLKIESVLDNAMKFSEEFINAEASSIYELDEETNELFIRVARGEKKELINKVRLKVGEGIAGWVVQTGKPLVVQDVCKEKRFCDKYDRLNGFKTRSLICVPLMLRGKSTGAIQVLNKKGGKTFTKADLEILISLSQQIAVAMENANLYSRLEERFQMTAGELKAAQEELIRTERLAAMGNLLNGIAHEIRNPIMTIGGFALRIKDSTSGNAGLQRYIDIVLSETTRLENLVKKVNEFLGVQSASIKTEDIKPAIKDVLKKFRPLAKKHSVKILTDLEDDLPLIEMDRQQISIALENIIENALEAMPHGGKIEIIVKRMEKGIKLILEDNGSGISEKELDSIYDPFVTSKPSRVGLGLTMAHQIIKNHNGEIEIASRESEGTTVAIFMPVKHN